MTTARKKRSSHVALAILGAAAFALAGCREEGQVDAQAFPDVDSCKELAIKSGKFDTAACDAAFADAKQLHVESAPRYDSLASCEAQHGAGACGNEAQSGTGEQAQSGGGMGSIFMPLMMGYLMGNMMGGGRSVAASQPMYQTPDGKFTTPAGNTTFSSNSGAAKVAPSQFTRPPSTFDKPPMSTGTAQSRGGFGASGGGMTGS